MSVENGRADPGGTGVGDTGSRLGSAWRPHVIAPILVGAAVGAVLLVSGWRSLRPIRGVEVTSVVVREASAPRGRPGGDGVVEVSSSRGSSVTVQAPGWLEADPFYVACAGLADGVVEEILVLEGERVEAGQIVAKLVSEDAELALAIAEANLLAAEAERGVSIAEVTAAQTEWDNPVERRRAVDAARASLAEVEADLVRLVPEIAVEEAVLERIREERERVRLAVETGATNTIELIRREQAAAAQLGRLEAARARRAILEARLDRERAELRAAEENLRLRIEERRALDIATARHALAHASVARATAERDEAALRLDRMTIRAPISGFVQLRLKLPGDKVMMAMDDPMSAHLVHLYDPSKIQVRVDVPLADAAHVFVGHRCEVIVEVLPEETFQGVVTRVTHEADVQKNTLQVKVAVVDPSPLLRPEMLTRVKFLPGLGAETERPGRSNADQEGAGGLTLLIPAASIEPEGGDATGKVWVVRDRSAGRGRLLQLGVRLGPTRGDWIRVLGGVQPGDLVVTSSREGLRPGQAVRVLPMGIGEERPS